MGGTGDEEARVDEEEGTIRPTTSIPAESRGAGTWGEPACHCWYERYDLLLELKITVFYIC